MSSVGSLIRSEVSRSAAETRRGFISTEAAIKHNQQSFFYITHLLTEFENTAK